MDNFWPWWGLWIIFWAIFGIVMSRIHWGRRKLGDRSAEKSAMDILKERYAKGEINKQEFEEKKKDIASQE
jgi:putative membrane protein